MLIYAIFYTIISCTKLILGEWVYLLNKPPNLTYFRKTVTELVLKSLACDFFCTIFIIQHGLFLLVDYKNVPSIS